MSATRLNPALSVQTGDTGSYTGNANTYYSKSITFPQPFAEVPLVVIRANMNGVFCNVEMGNPSRTGFKFGYRSSSTLASFSWQAIGVLA